MSDTDHIPCVRQRRFTVCNVLDNFDGDKQAARTFKQTAGVIEGRPGILETTNIDPLNENSNKGS